MLEKQVDVSVSESVESEDLGQILRRARENAGMSVKAAAASLHVGNFVISDLEDGKYEKFSAKIYIKGYIKLYARLLGLNEKEVVDLFETKYVSKDVNKFDTIFSKDKDVMKIKSQAIIGKKRGNHLFAISTVVLIIVFVSASVWWRSEKRVFQNDGEGAVKNVVIGNAGNVSDESFSNLDKENDAIDSGFIDSGYKDDFGGRE